MTTFYRMPDMGMTKEFLVPPQRPDFAIVIHWNFRDTLGKLAAELSWRSLVAGDKGSHYIDIDRAGVWVNNEDVKDLVRAIFEAYKHLRPVPQGIIDSIGEIDRNITMCSTEQVVYDAPWNPEPGNVV